MPAGKKYNISFTVECDKYVVHVATTAFELKNIYSMEIQGGVKTKLFSALTIESNSLIENFKININVNVN